MKLPRFRLPHWLEGLSIAIALGGGSISLVGWIVGDPTLTQVVPELTPVLFSQAICLLLLGIGRLPLLENRFRLARVAAVLALILAIASSAPGFEREFLHAVGPSLNVNVSFFAERPACSLATTISLILLAGQVFARSGGKSRLWYSLLTSLLLVESIFLVLLPAFGVALIGSVRPLPWGIALTVLTFSARGLVEFRFPTAWKIPSAARILPFLAMGISGLVTFIFWYAVSANGQARLTHRMESEADELMREIRQGISSSLLRFDNLVKDWHRDDPTLPERKRTAGGIMGYVRSAISTGWVEPSGKLTWLEYADPYGVLRDYLEENRATIEQFLAEARGSESPRISTNHLDPIYQYHLMLAYIPAPLPDGGGALIVFSSPELFGSILTEQIQGGRRIEVRSKSGLIFQSLSLSNHDEYPPQKFSFSPTQDQHWQIKIWPSDSLLDRESIPLAPLLLLAGLVMSGFLGLTTFLFFRSREQARQVAQSDALSRSLIDNLQQAVFLKDIDLKYRAVNRVFCDQIGRPESEILGRTDAELFPNAVEKQSTTEESRILLEGIRLEREESVTLQGKGLIFQAMRSPLRDSSGRVSGVLGVSWDVTEQRHLEIQLRQAQKMDALGKLAGGIAHDFNNLLTVMIGNLFLMRDEIGSGENPEELIEEAEKAANRAAELVRQLLSFSRQTPIRFETVSMPALIAEVMRLVRRTIDAKVQIEVAVPENLWAIEGDMSQLHQVLMNLCINARDAMPNGGVLRIASTNISLTPYQIHGRIDARSGDFVRLTVSDNGSGMTPEVRSRIFEPFFTTKGVGKGTGLGLAQVFGIAQQHHGWIECRSTFGVGTSFDLYFPRSMIASDPSASVAEAIPSGSETILVIDDEAMIRNLVQRIFTTAGYRVLTASDGKEGIGIYRTRPDVDMVMLDLNMPGLSGQETFRELLRFDPNVKVLISSGYSEEHLETHEAILVSAFLSKPFRRDDLLRVVREVLDSNSKPRRTGGTPAASLVSK